MTRSRSWKLSFQYARKSWVSVVSHGGGSRVLWPWPVMFAARLPIIVLTRAASVVPALLVWWSVLLVPRPGYPWGFAELDACEIESGPTLDESVNASGPKAVRGCGLSRSPLPVTSRSRGQEIAQPAPRRIR